MPYRRGVILPLRPLQDAQCLRTCHCPGPAVHAEFAGKLFGSVTTQPCFAAALSSLFSGEEHCSGEQPEQLLGSGYRMPSICARVTAWVRLRTPSLP